MASFKEEVSEHISAVYQTAVDEIKNWVSALREVWPLVFLLILALAILFGLQSLRHPIKY